MNGKLEAAGGFKLTRLQDIISPIQEVDHLDAGPMAGTWFNTNRHTKGMKEITVEPSGDGVRINIVAEGADGPVDWGWAEGELFGCIEEDGLPSVVISSRYEVGFMKSQLQIRLNRGVLVVASFNEFAEGSGKSNYFTREFFHS